MSVRVMGLVFDLTLTPSPKMLLMSLSDHAHDDGTNVRPSIPSMARKASLSERHVQRLLKAFQRPIEGLAADVNGRRLLVQVKRATNLSPAEYRIDVDLLRILGRHGVTSKWWDHQLLGRHQVTSNGPTGGDLMSPPEVTSSDTPNFSRGDIDVTSGGDIRDILEVTSYVTQTVSTTTVIQPSENGRAPAPVHTALARFAERWAGRHGRPAGAPADAKPLRPVIADQDAANLKRRIDHAGLEVVLRAIDAYFDSPDPFYADRGHALGIFCSATQFNRLIAHGRTPAAMPMPDLDQPIPWGQRGCVIRKWNERTPDRCRAITNDALSPGWLEAEAEQLAKFPKESFWDLVMDQFHESAFLRGETKPTPQNPKPLAKTLDWLFDKGARGIENAVLVHDGKYRDGAPA